MPLAGSSETTVRRGPLVVSNMPSTKMGSERALMTPSSTPGGTSPRHSNATLRLLKLDAVICSIGA
ncbi:MAG: hypothetical protein ABI024_01415 [Vicinamibacterales bacterium]